MTRLLAARPERIRSVAVVGLAAAVLSTCTGAPAPEVGVGGTEPVADTEALADAGALLAAPLDLPAPDLTIPALGVAGAPALLDHDGVPSAPDTTDAPAALPDEVEVHDPDLVLRGEDGAPLSVERADEVLADEEVHAATATQLDVEVETDDGGRADVTALAVDVDDFRPLTPDVTAQAVGVWERLRDGDVLVRHDVAHELGLELGGTVTLRSPSATVPARIGAFAANGAPPLADLLVPRSLGELLGDDAPNVLIVADAADPAGLGDRLRQAVGGALELLRTPPQQQARPKAAGSVTLEPFRYRSRGDGTIAIDGDWVARNIVPVEIPGMGTTRCHRAMVPQLLAALQEVADAGLAGHLDRSQFGGCWVPRHILWDPDRGLSMHAWGLAIDFNTRDNAYGAAPKMDPRIVRIFERWGFEWGGWWSTPDGMHFELARVVEVG